MNPAVLAVLTILAKWGPLAYEKAVAIIHSKDPTQADWDALLVAVRGLDYDKAVAEAEARAKP